MIDLPKNKKIILFDGICNFCNNAVLKTINYDKKNQFVFASLQSEVGKKITNYLGVDTSKIDSIILYEPNNAYYIKSTAALKVMAEFGGFWQIASSLMVFPEGFRNLVYDYIAKNRYKWFGKKEKCMIPTKEIREKFLE